MALALLAVAVAAVLVVSGGTSTDPRTPKGMPGLPPPFFGVAVVGSGGLTAAVDSYGDVVDLRAPGPAGAALIDNPAERQTAGTVSAGTGIVPKVAIGSEGPQPLWRADSVRQRYLPGTNVLATEARLDGTRAEIVYAAHGGELGCIARVSQLDEGSPTRVPARVEIDFNLLAGRQRIHCNNAAAERIIDEAAREDRRWVSRALPLDGAAPDWARRMYERSLLALRALTDRSNGAVAAGARDGWAYVWPRDAGAVALAFGAAGFESDAKRTARFLLGLDLNAAARFDGDGEPVPGREAQGDAEGWTEVAARAAGLPARRPGQASSHNSGESRNAAKNAPALWRDHSDYQEKSAGDYLANAIASFAPAAMIRKEFGGPHGLTRDAEDSESGVDSAAAWAVRPFPQPALFPAARASMHRLISQGSRFGIVPSEDWPEPDPWSAPTAWSAWSFAALANHGRLHISGRAPSDRRAALHLLAALRRASTPTGLLPERVDARTGVPRSTTPLAWSHAFAVLALRELWPSSTTTKR